MAERNKPAERDANLAPAAPKKAETGFAWTPPSAEEAKAMPLGVAITCARNEYDSIRKTQEGQIQNRKYKYADLADILAAIDPVLAKYHIEIFNQTKIENLKVRPEEKKRDDRDNRRRDRDEERSDPVGAEEEPWIILTVTAAKGDDESVAELPICRVGSKSQDIGAAITYMRRYGLQMVLGISPDDDTDGQSDDASSGRRFDPREDERRARDEDSRSRDRDDDSWRDNPPRDERGENDRRREDERGSGRRGPDLSRLALDTIQLIKTAGNTASCENFWKSFKSKNPSDDEFEHVKKIYVDRYKHLRDSDPLGMDERSRDRRADEAEKPKPDVPVEDEHVSPDEMIRNIEKELENITSLAAYHEWIEKNRLLLDAASQFPPDADTVNDMLDATMNRVIASGGRESDKEKF